MQNLYPPEHPYSWPVIGWHEDLDAADLDDLQRFFLRWYGPNNATLTIGGVSADFTVTTAAAPTVSSFSPTFGVAGTVVTITGTNLTGATSAEFEPMKAPAPIRVRCFATPS